MNPVSAAGLQPSMADLERSGTWLETSTLCHQLEISRATLSRWRRRGLLRAGHHWVRKNPAARRSDLLWHQPHCAALVARSRDRRPRPTPQASSAASPEPAVEYVLLHRDTGTALYSTRATAAEIQRANCNLSRCGNRNRYVAARHLGHQGPQPQA